MKFGPMAEAYGLEFAEVKPVDIMMKYTWWSREPTMSW